MIKVKLGLTPYLEQLVSEIAEITGRSKTACVELLLEQVEHHARHGKLPETFGLAVIEAAAVVNARGLGARHLDPVHQAGGEHVDFDVSLLERSNKTKTGFAGVSTTGTGFRALVPDPEVGGTRYLPSRPTALLAAIDRYRWFERFGIPYGNLGWHIAELKKKHPEWDDRQCLEQLRLLLEDGNASGLKNPITLEEVERALARYPERDNKPANSSRLAAVPDILQCAICKSEITATEPFGPYGKDGYAHTSCLD